MIDTHTIYKRSPQIVAATLEQKSLLLHVTNWVYVELNESGSRIWELLEDGKSVDQVVDSLCLEFNVDPQLCAKDTSELLESLEARQFVERA